MHTKSIPWFLRHVHGQLGNHENPLGSNRQEYGVEFGWNGVSWCVEFAWCMFTDAGVTLPVKTASCVVLYDAATKDGLHYNSGHCRPGDVIIRSWEGKPRATLNPFETHCQIVVATKIENGHKWLGVIGGNQGAGYVGPDVEWVQAGISTILGGLAFHRLFDVKQKPGGRHDKRRDTPKLPKPKSHPHAGEHPHSDKRLHYGPIRSRVVPRITHALNSGHVPSADAKADLLNLCKAIGKVK